jgi:hypothetical protein
MGRFQSLKGFGSDHRGTSASRLSLQLSFNP